MRKLFPVGCSRYYDWLNHNQINCELENIKIDKEILLIFYDNKSPNYFEMQHLIQFKKVS